MTFWKVARKLFIWISNYLTVLTKTDLKYKKKIIKCIKFILFLSIILKVRENDFITQIWILEFLNLKSENNECLQITSK